jgi:hypothetical protein
MKSIIVVLLTAVSLVVCQSAAAQTATRGVMSLNRHHMAAAKELEAFRLYEQSTHPRVLNAGNFFIGSGGSADANNYTIPDKPTRQSVEMPLQHGVDHLIIVSCDEDCLLLNVRVFDGSNRLVGEDSSPTRTDSRYMVKTVQLVPESDQNFRVETEIACRAGSRGGCSFAIGVNTK